MTRKFISTILIASTLIVLLGLLIYFITSYSYVKFVSLINFYDKDLEVDFNGQKYSLKPFDTKLIQIKDLRNANIKGFIEGQTVYEKNIGLSYETQILALYFSDVKHCYYQTNLSREESTLKFTNIDTPQDYLLIDANVEKDYYFLPGSHPSQVDNTKNLVGYLPLPCTEVSIPQIVLANNQLFWNYNSELQREYYFSNIDKINNSTSLNQLTEISGVTDQSLDFLLINGQILFIHNSEDREYTLEERFP